MVEDWRSRNTWWRRIQPPRPVYHNPEHRRETATHPLGRWNLYIGGAGNSVPGYVNIDLFPLPGVDVACTAECLPFRESVFSFVECMAVLEHVEDPSAVVDEVFRCLVPGGMAQFVVPFCHPFHEYPRDFRRYSPDGLALLCSRFDRVSSGWLSGPTATWLVMTLEYAKSWFTGRTMRGAVHFTLGWLLFPLRYLDAVLLRRPGVRRIGNHHYLFVRKPTP